MTGLDTFLSTPLAMMLVSNLIATLEWGGMVVFAMSGALVASRKQMDVFGFILLACATGIGGGTLRDLLLGLTPVFWISQPAYLVVCVGVAILTFFTAHIPQSRLKLLLWLDAFGMALFAVVGAEKALDAGAGPTIAVAMGVVTASFGGIIRDILGGEAPIVLRREIYVTAAFLGCVAYVGLIGLGMGAAVAAVAGFLVTLITRGAALIWGWSLPVYKPRPGRNPEDIGL